MEETNLSVMVRIVGVLALMVSGVLVQAQDVRAKEPVTVVDLAGRTVTVQAPVESLILGEGRFLPTIAILDRKDPTQRIAAMMGEFKQLDPASYGQYQAAFPRIDKIPLVGRGGATSFSSERAIHAHPDVAVFGLSSGHGPSARHTEILDQLKAAGIPVVIIDFRMDPLVNTPKSIALLGRLLGREKEAAEFLAFYREQLDLIKKRLDGVRAKPGVFMESRVGLREGCCEAIGDAMMGRFVAWAGGRNVFAKTIPGTHAMISLEHLMVAQPDIYIGTAIGSYSPADPRPKRIVLGANAPAALARASLKRALGRTGLADLTAVTSGQAYALWHHFYNTPMNVVAVQVLAKWFHPERFTDVDPRATLATYFKRFQPFPVQGVYWTGLKAE